MKTDIPIYSEKERSKELIKIINFKNGEQLTKFYLKSDVFLLADNSEKYMKVAIEEFNINPLYSVSSPRYTWQCVLKHTNIKSQTLQDKDMILLLENNIRGGNSSVMGDRYVKSDENKKITIFDAKNLYVYSLTQLLSNDEINCDSNVKIEDTRFTPDDSDIA